ncbi:MULTISPECIES: MarR family winged helix-turn-helix transcriptional regulator [Nocardia]|uniref:MarR family winged helix-turn-helix transcriptional regulator n=1 Tax=Nocardia TaxID=1817 RepID=UPI00189630F7|nr:MULTISPECIES: MarR family transcriptional regulator [Nocardia]MBF6352013.1 MarR family transcriptional regulator [Nocardia flavorosea]
MTETRWLDERESRAWRGYLAMHTQLAARLHRQLQHDSGLSLSDFEVLVRLTDQPEPRLRVGELGQLLQWEKSRLSHHLARMQKRGLVRREDCPDDARGAYIVLTEQGRTAIEQAAPGHVETVRELLFDALTDEQVESFGAIVARVLDRLDNSQ